MHEYCFRAGLLLEVFARLISAAGLVSSIGLSDIAGDVYQKIFRSGF